MLYLYYQKPPVGSDFREPESIRGACLSTVLCEVDGSDEGGEESACHLDLGLLTLSRKVARQVLSVD